jgi:hypothetical protein
VSSGVVIQPASLKITPEILGFIAELDECWKQPWLLKLDFRLKEPKFGG